MKDALKDIGLRFARMIGKLFGWAGVIFGTATVLFVVYPDQFPPWVWFATALIAAYKQKAYDIFKIVAGGKNERVS